MSNVTNLSRLTLIRRTTMGKHPKGIYRCVCGVEKEIIMNKVLSGKTLSCGCYHKEVITKHGLYQHPLYQVWADIKDRCDVKNSELYPDYAGRGVTMWEGWKDNFKSFYDWCMANGWKKGLQVDKDIKGASLIYSPWTCTIATCKENNNAKRNNRLIEFEGKIKTMSAWAEQFGIQPYTLWNRLNGASAIVDRNIFRKPRYKAPNGTGRQIKKQT